jgi:uncharacterized protein
VPAPNVAAGYDFPALTGRVVDAANLLSPADRAALTAKLDTLERTTGHQFVVVTVGSTGTHEIEDYGLTLGNTWHVGRKGFDDGVLLIVAMQQRQVRIEVGKGLIGDLTNGEAGTIITGKMVPAFKAGDFPRGIIDGVDGVIHEISASKRQAA